ncbi:MAG: hypothetical protein GX915_01595 [Clostridiales bacterium]|nr:hypothetical protein [Clostridiales bacterium]
MIFFKYYKEAKEAGDSVIVILIASKFSGTLLKFKPILQVKDGVIGVLGKERGSNKGIAKVLELMDEAGEMDHDYPVYFGYTAEDDKGLLLKEKATEKYGLTSTNFTQWDV